MSDDTRRTLINLDPNGGSYQAWACATLYTLPAFVPVEFPDACAARVFLRNVLAHGAKVEYFDFKKHYSLVRQKRMQDVERKGFTEILPPEDELDGMGSPELQAQMIQVGKEVIKKPTYRAIQSQSTDKATLVSWLQKIGVSLIGHDGKPLTIQQMRDKVCELLNLAPEETKPAKAALVSGKAEPVVVTERANEDLDALSGRAPDED